MKGYSGAKYKSFGTREEAEFFVAQHGGLQQRRSTASSSSKPAPVANSKEKKRPLSQSTTTTGTTSSTLPSIPDSKRLKTISNQPNHNADITYLINFDGGSRGNPGLAGCGAEVIEVRKHDDTNVLLRSKTRLHYFLLGKQTNNQAEYWGLIKALDCVYNKLSSIVVPKTNDNDTHPRPKVISLAVQGDSKLIIQQMKGAFRVGPSLLQAHEQAQSSVQRIQELCRDHRVDCQLSWEHVYRTDNHIADGESLEDDDETRYDTSGLDLMVDSFHCSLPDSFTQYQLL